MSQESMTEAADAELLEGKGLRIGVVQARFNAAICNATAEACLDELARLGVADEDVTVVSVPGALELPLVLQKLAHTESYDALVAIGCVIRGETYHFEIVSNESSRGVSEVALRYDIPVANAVLTCENEAQAEARARPKGVDAARVAVEMANLAVEIDALQEPEEDENDQ